MDKNSHIPELKVLADKLTDRDTGLKSCFKRVKQIINCPKTSNEEKLEKIKNICNGS